MESKHTLWVPFTPGGSCCMDLASKTENEAWNNLLFATAHMPYQSREDLEKRGYEVVEIKGALE